MSQSDKKVAVPAKEKALSSCEADEVEKYFVLLRTLCVLHLISHLRRQLPLKGKPYYAPLVYLPPVEPGVYFHA